MGFLGFSPQMRTFLSAPPHPRRNYFEKLMQNFERKEEGKKRKKIDLYALYTTTWSLIDKYEATLFSSSPHRGRANSELSAMSSRNHGGACRPDLVNLEKQVSPLWGCVLGSKRLHGE